MNRRKEKLRAAQSPRVTGTMTGELHVARNGSGYLIHPETGDAVWIDSKGLGTALPGDRVTVKLRGEDKDALLLRIDARAERMIVGTLIGAVGRFTLVQPMSPMFRQAFTVPDACGAQPGDRVVMRFVRWDNPRLAPCGEISEVIGPADDPSLDALAVMRAHDLPEEFPEAVVREAELVSELREGKRLDLRRKFIFTCDPESARDYDDALSIETDKAGNTVLGVHIADVSHFVRPGTALDREAYRRSTSVYLVGKVVPMLPEQLSNGVCSLVPGRDRLAFSVFLTYDGEGRCIARRFAKSVIRSRARFTYEQVMAVISGGGKPGLKPNERRTVLAVSALAQRLRRLRFAEGALDMDVPEAEVKLDEKGMMTGIEVRPYDESHQMVEECMVAANEAVATELWTRGIKLPARLHEAPDPDRLEELRGNLLRLGIGCGDLSNRRNLAKFLKKIKGTPLEGPISVMVLRSMKRALYSAEKIGHFGLAKSYYAHFTSPIRRYPDLILHRQLASYLEGKGGRLDQAWLKTAAAHCSEREQNADDAERELTEIKKYRYLEAIAAGDRAIAVPNRFEAVISKCTRYGVFVDLPEIAIGGMVHISVLSDDYVRFDEAGEHLVAGSRSWSVGDRIEVKVAKVDFDRRMIDFEPIRQHDGGKCRRKGR